MFKSFGGTTLAERWQAGSLIQTNPAAFSTPMANTAEKRPFLSGTGGDMAPPAGVMRPACLPSDLPRGVMRMRQRALSTRCLYAQKWSVFSIWCLARKLDPTKCRNITIVTHKELLNGGHTPSTLKIYVAAIAMKHGRVSGQSIGKHNLVLRFLRGARRMNPPCPCSVLGPLLSS